MKRTLLLLLLVAMSSPATVFAMPNCGVLAESYLEFKKLAQGEGEGDAFDQGIYMGYIKGYADALTSSDQPFVEIPKEVNNGEIYAVVGKWLQANPERPVCADHMVMIESPVVADIIQGSDDIHHVQIAVVLESFLIPAVSREVATHVAKMYVKNFFLITKPSYPFKHVFA